jgi:hypothetical protein
MAKGLCDSFCKGCIYNGYGVSDTVTICTYFLTTDNRRPCPAGSGCTVKQTGRKKGKWEQEKDESWKQREKTISKEVLHRVCPCCGTEFDTNNKRKIYCSRKCTGLSTQRAFQKRRREIANAKG